MVLRVLLYVMVAFYCSNVCAQDSLGSDWSVQSVFFANYHFLELKQFDSPELALEHYYSKYKWKWPYRESYGFKENYHFSVWCGIDFIHQTTKYIAFGIGLRYMHEMSKSTADPTFRKEFAKLWSASMPNYDTLRHGKLDSLTVTRLFRYQSLKIPFSLQFNKGKWIAQATFFMAAYSFIRTRNLVESGIDNPIFPWFGRSFSGMGGHGRYGGELAVFYKIKRFGVGSTLRIMPETSLQLGFGMVFQ